jgi:hypothetical protein
MANVRNSNTIHVDATGAITGSTEINVKVAYILFTPSAAEDNLVLKDDDNSGDIKFDIRAATAKDTMLFDFSYAPVLFPNGIYVSTLSAGAKATLITTTAGGR